MRASFFSTAVGVGFGRGVLVDLALVVLMELGGWLVFGAGMCCSDASVPCVPLASRGYPTLTVVAGLFVLITWC